MGKPWCPLGLPWGGPTGPKVWMQRMQGLFVHAPTDVAEERNNFEQPFSEFGQPGPHFDENLESIDGRKNRENKIHRNFTNGIATPDSKAARQERQGAWVTVHGGYFQSKILHLCCSVGLPRAPSHSMLGMRALEKIFLGALVASPSTLIARGRGGNKLFGDRRKVL